MFTKIMKQIALTFSELTGKPVYLAVVDYIAKSKDIGK